MKKHIWNMGLFMVIVVVSLVLAAQPASAGPVNMPTFQSPLPKPPAAPSGLGATDVSDTEIGLWWRDNSNNESGFWIQRSTNGYSWTTIMIVPPNMDWYVDGGLSCNIWYYYRVMACNPYGCSSYSNVAYSKTMGCGERP